MRHSILCLLLFIMGAIAPPLYAYDLSRPLIDIDSFITGGPGKDDIPAISRPVFGTAEAAAPVEDDDLVIGVVLNGEARAYPLDILNWHEVVNDSMQGDHIAVTWCPLTRSAIVFDRTVDGEVLSFGVTGRLYRNNLVMYDRTTDGLWPQLWSGAVTGRFSGRKLEIIPSRLTSWAIWKRTYAASLVLTRKTGVQRPYDRDPCAQYQKSPDLIFPLQAQDRDGRWPLKGLVLGVIIHGVDKAYPLSQLDDTSQPYGDTLGGIRILIHKDTGKTAHATDEQGALVPAYVVCWFGWSVFHRNTFID